MEGKYLEFMQRLGNEEVDTLSFWCLPTVMGFLDCGCLLHFAFLSVFSLVLKTHLGPVCVLIHNYLLSISVQALLLNKVMFTGLG